MDVDDAPSLLREDDAARDQDAELFSERALEEAWEAFKRRATE